MNQLHNTQPGNSLSVIGNLIRDARERRGFTQKQFSHILHTSQSAIARIESGDQNLTMELLSKINNALETRILTTNTGNDDFIINGGKQLSGNIQTNTSKNGALHMLCAALINKGTTTLHHIPRNQEILRIVELFQSMNIDISWVDKNSLQIKNAHKVNLEKLNTESASRIRSGLMAIGSLAHHVQSFDLPHSGGCKMGERTIAAHRHGLLPLGVTITTSSDHYHISVSKSKSNRVVMYESSDTGTTNVLLAAARLAGPTTIVFAQQNYMVMDVCYLLQKMGVRIEGLGSHILTVYGLPSYHCDIEHSNSEDPIETMFWLSAGATTASNICIERAPIDFLELELLKLELMGLKIKRSKNYLSHNGISRLCDISISQSKLTALSDKLHALPFPGINTDNLPFFVPIATQAKGRTLINDWMWEERAIYFTELNKLGAKITLLDPHRVIIDGPTDLRGSQIVCPPALRPSAVILIAMLAASGSSMLRNVYSISRGYENLAERLNSIGADVRAIRSIVG